MPPDEPTEEEKQEELPQDNQTPFQAADPPRDDTTTPPLDNNGQPVSSPTLDDTHPSTDTNIEQPELYDEGVAGAAEAEEPNKGNSVVDYEPEQKGDQDD